MTLTSRQTASQCTLCYMDRVPSGMDRRRCRRWYREVAVKSFENQLIRSLLTTRAQLVRMRVNLANQIWGVLKPFGLKAGKGGGQAFADRVG